MIVTYNSLLNGSRGNWYSWAEEMGLYIEQSSLEDMMNDSDTKYLVIDTRDDDAQGGSIKGGIHLPDGKWDEKSSQKILDSASTTAKDTFVVFHCMESARRGPRCARRFLEYLINFLRIDYDVINEPAALRNLEKYSGIPRVRILKGGADLWIRHYHRRDSKVENFDDNFWGFDDIEPEMTGEHHVLYKRPIDQCPTPWTSLIC